VLNPDSHFSNFAFLTHWPELQQRAQCAEAHIRTDPRVSAFYARNCLELLVETVFDIDNWLTRPRHDATLMSLIHEPRFKDNLKHGLFGKFKLIIQIGNAAVHDRAAPQVRDALQSVVELHHVLYWFARTYTPDLDRTHFNVAPFDPTLIPESSSSPDKGRPGGVSSARQIQALEQQLAAELANENATLKAENQLLLAQIAAAKAAAAAVDDTHDYHEADTRRYLIDTLLQEAGWKLDQPRDTEYPVSGMPLSKANPNGNGKVDYVLWNDDGKALAVVEAKRTSKSPEAGQHQAKLYADCLEQQCGVRPVIFYSNGYETRLWDDTQYPPRDVQGFYRKDELALLIKRRSERKPFFDAEGVAAKINNDISNRHYQKTALTQILDTFEQERRRKALLVMATGTGKTRTVISLVDLLTRHDWIKNILFLADRNALLTQAKKNFVRLLPRISCSLLDAAVTKGTLNSRLYFATYPTLKNVLDRPASERPFGVGHFDLVIVDEAHRSVYQKYRQIFSYFDGLLVGLTATPKDEVDKNTYGLFDLQDGMPTYAYEDYTAYAEKFLVPPTRIAVATRFMRHGIKYAQLSEAERREWEEKEALAERDEVLPQELNKFLFNKNTADKMFAQLFKADALGGIHVEGGDVIGKTIIFAANHDHAEFLQKQFDKNFPKWKGKLAQVITYKNPYAQALIDEFSVEGVPFDAKNPQLRIAISVDMLDTGIDVPDVVNLVFFKVVQSKVKFTQMLGRGTRLCPDLFAPGEDKTTFRVFDYCQNFEFFGQNPQGAPDSVNKPLGRQLFEKRVQLATLISAKTAQQPDAALDALKTYQLDLLHHQVTGMNLKNFIVRPKRQQIEPFLAREYWNKLNDSKHVVLESHIAALPTEAEAFNPEEQRNELANRFDNLIVGMQLTLLEKGCVPETARQRVMEFAQRLEGKTSIPAVLKHLGLIQSVQTAEFWQDAALPTLENLRRTFRNLMFALDKLEKQVVYTDFKDELLAVADVTGQYPNTSSLDLTQYRRKTETYIRDHQDHLTIQKLKRNKPITKPIWIYHRQLKIRFSYFDDPKIIGHQCA
jgi:type I restriction enzyme R subunit